jgi:hypothetical protein
MVSKKKISKKEEIHQKYDKAFQGLFEEFREDFGIESKKDYQLDEKWQYKRPDTIIILENNFDYSKLSNKTFPCLKEWNVIEFKSCKEKLSVDLIAKYIANGNLLASQMLLYKQKGLEAINEFTGLIMVSSNKVSDDIMMNFKESKFRKGFYELTYSGFLTVYLVVIDDLDIVPCNYPLLLLGNEEKQEELWKLLIDEIKRDLNAKNTDKLWKYLMFSIRSKIFSAKEGSTMRKVKEVLDENDCINQIFDDELLKKILLKKGNDSAVKIIIQILKESDELKRKIQQELKNEG